MFFAKWKDVPAFVGLTVLLNVSPYLYSFVAANNRAINWDWSATKILPVFQPTPAFADVACGSVDILDFHSFLLIIIALFLTFYSSNISIG